MIDLTGQKFGRLVVIKRVENDKYGNHRWLCQCDCKHEVIVLGFNLKTGHTKSCGCLQKEKTIERSTKHGHKKNGKPTREYKSWADMIQRCTNPNDQQWKDYGGRNIKVCKRWLGKDGFIHFIADMGRCPLGCTLERRKNKKGYYLDNCKWATPKEQARNRRNNRYEMYKGKNRLFVELCEEYNMPYMVVYNRFYNYGWTLEEALTTLVGQRRTR